MPADLVAKCASCLADENRPASTTVAISGLAREGALLEIEAVSVLPAVAAGGGGARSARKTTRRTETKVRGIVVAPTLPGISTGVLYMPEKGGEHPGPPCLPPARVAIDCHVTHRPALSSQAQATWQLEMNRHKFLLHARYRHIS
jgi:hypothetical protein